MTRIGKMLLDWAKDQYIYGDNKPELAARLIRGLLAETFYNDLPRSIEESLFPGGKKSHLDWECEQLFKDDDECSQSASNQPE